MGAGNAGARFDAALEHSGHFSRRARCPGRCDAPGTGVSFPASYVRVVNQFVADLAASDGAVNNVFATLSQYTDQSHSRLQYKIHAGPPLVDPSSYPPNGCTPDSGTIWRDGTAYSRCITN